MTTTPQKIQQLLDQHTESVTRAYIEYLSMHTKAKPAELLRHWVSFKKNDEPVIVTPLASSDDKQCVHVFTRGSKSGSACGLRVKPGTDFCTKHLKSKKVQTTPLSPTDIDKDVLEIVSEEDDTHETIDDDELDDDLSVDDDDIDEQY